MTEVKAERCCNCNSIEWSFYYDGKWWCLPCGEDRYGWTKFYRKYLRGEVLRFLSLFKW